MLCLERPCGHREGVLEGACKAGDVGVAGAVHGDVAAEVAVSAAEEAGVDQHGGVDDQRLCLVVGAEVEAVAVGAVEGVGHLHRDALAVDVLEGLGGVLLEGLQRGGDGQAAVAGDRHRVRPPPRHPHLVGIGPRRQPVGGLDAASGARPGHVHPRPGLGQGQLVGGGQAAVALGAEVAHHAGGGYRRRGRGLAGADQDLVEGPTPVVPTGEGPTHPAVEEVRGGLAAGDDPRRPLVPLPLVGHKRDRQAPEAGPHRIGGRVSILGRDDTRGRGLPGWGAPRHQPCQQRQRPEDRDGPPCTTARQMSAVSCLAHSVPLAPWAQIVAHPAWSRAGAEASRRWATSNEPDDLSCRRP